MSLKALLVALALAAGCTISLPYNDAALQCGPDVAGHMACTPVTGGSSGSAPRGEGTGTGSAKK